MGNHPKAPRISLRIILASVLLSIGCAATGQVDEAGIYGLVVNDAKEHHLQQLYFQGRSTVLVESQLNWYESGGRQSPRLTYEGQLSEALLTDLMNAGVIDSTCSLAEGSEAGCEDSLGRLLVSVTSLDASQEGRYSCQVLVRAPYLSAFAEPARARRLYYTLMQYVVGGEGESMRIIERKTILIT